MDAQTIKKNYDVTTQCFSRWSKLKKKQSHTTDMNNNILFTKICLFNLFQKYLNPQSDALGVQMKIYHFVNQLLLVSEARPVKTSFIQ